MHFTAFDFLAIAIILISSIMAFARGLLREVFSIVAFVGAAVAAIYLRPVLSPMLRDLVRPAILAELAAAGILFLVVFVAITLLTSTVAKAAHRSGEIGAIDRGAGLVFGAARGILVLALAILLMRQVTNENTPMPKMVAEARTYPVLSSVAEGLEAFVPKAKEAISKRNGAESAPPADENAPY
ncbi:MAG: CvpA family protein [Hyphomonadaceae bacterium]